MDIAGWTEIANQSSARYVGVRWQDQPAAIGEELGHCSIHPREWLENDCGIEGAEDERLSGVCAFAAELSRDGMSLDISDAVARAERLAAINHGARGYLLLLECERLGEDLPEADAGGVVMVGAKVLACIAA